MKAQSAGLLAYRLTGDEPEVFIVHPGGPFFAKKDKGIWTIPKGLYEQNEKAIQAAKREFEEETGFSVNESELLDLGEIYRSDGKTIKVWAFENDFDESKLKSNYFEIEWPPKSKNLQSFPEVDRGLWLGLNEAAEKLQPSQIPFLKRLADLLHVPFGSEDVPSPPAQNELF